MRIALTGGIACGKSLVAQYLNELGVATVDADDIVHELIPVEERRRLAATVFSDSAARKALEARIHPMVRERLAERVGELGDSSRVLPPSSSCGIPPVEIIPLLFECNWQSDYGIILCVRSTKERQLSRMMEMRGYSRTEAEGRLAAQMPVDRKVELSNYTIENNSSPEALRVEVKRALVWLKEEYGRRSRREERSGSEGVEG